MSVSGEGLPRNWMILLGHRRLQYIGEGLCLTLVIVSDELLVLSAGVVIRDLHSIPLV
jgi:hypothetical protein